VERRRIDLVRLLLREGADANGANTEYMGWSPLLLAIQGKQARTRRLLLKCGARIGLVEALAMADDRLVMQRLSQGRRALAVPAPNAGTYLMFARTPAAVDRLLALGVSPREADHWGRTPIDAFSRLGARGRPLVQRLVAAGVPATAEVRARLNDRSRLHDMVTQDAGVVANPTVLKAAVDAGHRALAQWLLDQGADPNGRGGGEADETCLHAAAWNGDQGMVSLLLEAGANPRLRDRQYDAPPSGWALTSVEVTGNAKCVDVAAQLQRAEAMAGG
jgi:ankyrin repeat protein